LTQQLDEFGAPLSGGLLYIIQAGTTSTPQNAFQDTALTLPLPNPITLDAAGRVPQFFLADGQIKVRLQNALGVVKFVADNLLVIGPSGGGGGGGGTVDPTTVIQTGDLKVRYDTAVISGFVRCNGFTIGSATSGATELADPSAQPLFNHLWLKDPNLAVTPGGRGASAAADWAAAKQIALPDWRGCTIAALDDMGNSPAGRLTTSYFGVAATVLGARSGSEGIGLTISNLPVVTPTGGASSSASGSVSYPCRAYFNGGGSTVPEVQLGANTAASQGNISATVAISVSTSISMNSFGGNQGHANCQPTKLATIYIKL
jgi:microcystin-dependent protein